MNEEWINELERELNNLPSGDAPKPEANLQKQGERVIVDLTVTNFKTDNECKHKMRVRDSFGAEKVSEMSCALYSAFMDTLTLTIGIMAVGEDEEGENENGEIS